MASPDGQSGSGGAGGLSINNVVSGGGEASSLTPIDEGVWHRAAVIYCAERDAAKEENIELWFRIGEYSAMQEEATNRMIDYREEGRRWRNVAALLAEALRAVMDDVDVRHIDPLQAATRQSVFIALTAYEEGEGAGLPACEHPGCVADATCVVQDPTATLDMDLCNEHASAWVQDWTQVADGILQKLIKDGALKRLSHWCEESLTAAERDYIRSVAS